MIDDADRARFLARVSAALGRKDGAPGARDALASAAAPSSSAFEPPRDRPALARRFRDELALVSGETVFLPDGSAVDAEIARIVESLGLDSAAGEVGRADYAVLHADALIADTGSALVIERTADRRLAPYLPRTCIVVADASALHPTLSSAALAALLAAARNGDKGEAVIITGPARTADIEKTLVLGAHGPRHLITIITGIASPDESTAP